MLERKGIKAKGSPGAKGIKAIKATKGITKGNQGTGPKIKAII